MIEGCGLCRTCKLVSLHRERAQAVCFHLSLVLGAGYPGPMLGIRASVTHALAHVHAANSLRPLDRGSLS